MSHLLYREVEAVEERAVDRHGNKYMTIKELQEQEAQRRAGLPLPTPPQPPTSLVVFCP